MTPYERHRKIWNKCKRCELHRQRRNVCLARGSVPCDVLFIGEAPGVSEDVLGRPFVGPAGKLTDRIIEEALGESHLRCALTNLVACFPREAKEEGNNEPPEVAIEACARRLKAFVGLCKPKLIVYVGKLAAKHGKLSVDTDCPFVEIIHPAAILRMDVSQQGLAFQRAVVTIADAVEEL